MKEERHFVKLYHDIMKVKKVNDVKLDLACRCVYAYLLSWQENNKEVYPSINRIKDDLGFNSKSSVNNYLKKLIQSKLLEVTYRKNNTSIYKVKPLYPEVALPTNSVKAEPPVQQHVEDYDDYPMYCAESEFDKEEYLINNF